MSKPYRRLSHIGLTLAKQHLYELLPDNGELAPIKRRLQWLSKPFAKPKQPVGDRLHITLCELGPVFIKLGQLLATRHDLLPADVIAQLVLLQDAVPPFDSNQAMAMIAKELNQPVNEVFSDIDATPLASASIAQVHSATLVSGEAVVIKLLRPNIRDHIEQDLNWLKLALRKIEDWLPDSQRLHPSRVIQTYEAIILNEINLLNEMDNTLQFARNFEHSNLLYVPKMHTQWCTPRMLIAERVYGIPLNQIEALDAAGVNRQVLSERGVTIFFTQVFRDNFFHADMHGGNIFVKTDNPQSPQYIALDCAIVGQLPDRDRLILAKTLMALLQQNYEGLAQLLVAGGWSQGWVDTAALAEDLKPICEPVLTASLSELSFGNLLTDLFRVAQHHDLHLQPQFVLLKKTLVHVEGLGRQLYPELDIWALGRPMLEQWLQSQFNPQDILSQWARLGQELPFIAQDLPHTLQHAHRWLHQAPHLVNDQRITLNRLERAMKKKSKGLLHALIGTLIILLVTLMPATLWDIPSAIRGIGWFIGGVLMVRGTRLTLDDEPTG